MYYIIVRDYDSSIVEANARITFESTIYFIRDLRIVYECKSHDVRALITVEGRDADELAHTVNDALTAADTKDQETISNIISDAMQPPTTP